MMKIQNYCRHFGSKQFFNMFIELENPQNLRFIQILKNTVFEHNLEQNILKASKRIELPKELLL